MRELTLISGDSDPRSLVFRLADTEQPLSGADGEFDGEFFVEVTEDLKRVLCGDSRADHSPASTDHPDAGSISAAAPLSENDNEDALSAPSASEVSTSPEGPASEPSAEQPSSGDTSLVSAFSSLRRADRPELHGETASEGSEPDAPAEEDAEILDAELVSEEESPAGAPENPAQRDDDDAVASPKTDALPERNKQGLKLHTHGGLSPRTGSRPHRSKISLSPREIQNRVRHGASMQELADEADTDVSRIEPYAWPILQERSRIAEMGRTAHPVNANGVSEEKLWEVLATAFAARGEKLADAEWDAFQDQARQWIITVSWNKDSAGQSASHVAEFTYVLEGNGPAIAQPRNSVAGDLVDPRYSQPVRLSLIHI